MGVRIILRVALLGFLVAGVFPAPAFAQFSAGSEKCEPLAPSSDEFKELTGKKVFPKIVIDDVYFDGPTLLPDSFRERIVAGLKQRELDGDPDWIERVEQTIRGAWQDEGYIEVRVELQPSSLRGDSTYQYVRLSIHVDEGLQYRLGGLQFRPPTTDAPLTDSTEQVGGKKIEVGGKESRPMYRTDHFAFPVEVLRGLIPIQEGEIFSAAKIREGLEAMRKFYGTKGYIDFTPEPQTEIDDSNQRINLTMVLDEEKQYRVGGIEISGLDANMESMLRSRLKSGDIFDYSVLERFIEEYKSALSPGASTANFELRKHLRDATVDVRGNFQRCPQIPD
jgi:outer membrane protein assembly factor BamA